MDALTLSNVAAYSAQVLCLVTAAGLLLALLRPDAPVLRYASLRTTLVICLLLPWLQTRQAPTLAPDSVVATSVVSVSHGVAADAVAAPAVMDWPLWILRVLVIGFMVRLLWLAIGMRRLRRLRGTGEIAEPEQHASLQERIGTNAEVRYVEGFAQPVAFGVRRPVILLPDSLRAQPPIIREAVLAHELVHVRRRDWAWVIAEEIARAVFWFHPAMWWLISRIQLAREEVVDALAVAYTGRRRAYVEALMTFADGVPLAPAPAFARKKHLFRRLMLISREDAMTAKRLVFSSMAIVAVMAVGGWYAVGAFPLVEASAGQILQKQPGPLEIAANPITPENPVPRRVYHEAPQYPLAAAAENAWVRVTFRATLDAAGNIAEARVVGLQFRMRDARGELSPANIEASEYERRAKPVVEAVTNAAVAALERWRYEPPANAPLSFDTTFYFAPGLPVSESPAAAPSIDRQDGALRVGGSVAPPTKIKDVRPIYPPAAQEAKVQGVVIAEIRIDEAGRVSDARILRSIPLLDQAALEAIWQWEFRPTLLNGVPTPVMLVVTVQFSLK